MKKGGTGKLIPTPRQKCPEKNPVLLWLKSLKKYLEKISKSKVETETQTKKTQNMVTVLWKIKAGNKPAKPK